MNYRNLHIICAKCGSNEVEPKINWKSLYKGLDPEDPQLEVYFSCKECATLTGIDELEDKWRNNNEIT